MAQRAGGLKPAQEVDPVLSSFLSGSLDANGTFQVVPNAPGRHVRLALTSDHPFPPALLQGALNVGSVINDQRTDVTSFLATSPKQIAGISAWLLRHLPLLPRQGSAAAAVALAALVDPREAGEKLMTWLVDAPGLPGGPAALCWAVRRAVPSQPAGSVAKGQVAA